MWSRASILPMSIIALRRSNCWSCWCSSCSSGYLRFTTSFLGGDLFLPLVPFLLCFIRGCLGNAGLWRSMRGLVRCSKARFACFAHASRHASKVSSCPTPVFFIEKLLLPISRRPKVSVGVVTVPAGEVMKAMSATIPRCHSSSTKLRMAALLRRQLNRWIFQTHEPAGSSCGLEVLYPFQSWLRFSSSRGGRCESHCVDAGAGQSNVLP